MEKRVKFWFSDVSAAGSSQLSQEDDDDGVSDSDDSDVEDFDFDEGDVGSSRPRRRRGNF